MKVRFFNPTKGYKTIKKEVDTEIQRVLGNGDLILRDEVEEFEGKLADYVGTKHAVGLNSGTDALFLALKAIGLKAGGEVLMPSYTFSATAEAIRLAGGTIRFYDKREIPVVGVNTRAIVVVHMEGRVQPRTHLYKALAKRYNLYLIEDACQALGASFKGQKAGNIGHVGCFSFYPAKILGCYGDGGAITTNDGGIMNYVKEARQHFKNTHYEWGVNSRLDNLQACVLNVKMNYLQEALDRREEIANRYSGGITNPLIKKPQHTKGRVWQDYIIQTHSRDKLYDFLKTLGVETMKNEYPFPVPKKPRTERYEKTTLRLPCNETLLDEEVDYVIKKINEWTV